MTDRQVGAARQRVLDVAQALFAENGFAGTSIADIAERLDVSKAAVYYHFQAKADLLRELINPVFHELRQIAELPAGEPRALVERLIDLLAAQRHLIGLIIGDPSAMHELKAIAPTETFAQMRANLAGPRASNTKVLRARCAMGVIHAAVVGPVIENAHSGGATPAEPMTAHERRVVIEAALAALGVAATSSPARRPHAD